MGSDGKYINLLIFGYDGKGARSFRLNLKVLKSLALSGFVITGGLVTFALVSFYQNISLREEVARLREAKNNLETMLAQEREKNAQLQVYKQKVLELESKLVNIDKFLRKKGIRKVPSGVGGAPSRVDVLDIGYLSFLHEEADRFKKYLSRTPLGPPVWGRITSHYGYRRDPFTRRYEFHKGVDIRAPRGAPVRATADGEVIFVGWKSGYGKTVILKHSYGFRTMYAHLSKIKVKVGQWVRSGEVIGKVGSTGRSTGPHVHYEVWRNSKTENPAKYMFVRW